MQLTKPKKTLVTLLIASSLIVLLFVLLPVALPFLLAYLLASAAEPGLRWLEKHTPLPRLLRSGICVSLLFLLLGSVLYFLCRVLWGELQSLARQLPNLLARLREPTAQLRQWLEGFAARLPEELGAVLLDCADRLFTGSSMLADALARRLSSLVSGAVAGMPGLVLNVVTTLLATYMSSAALPDVKRFLRARLPAAWAERLSELHRRLGSSLGSWVKAQLKLMGLVFAVLTVGLWLLGVEFALLFGALIAFLDALPVLGAGIILIPWALISFLQAEQRMGFGLLALYAAATLTRTVLEPRIVGRQLGLHPLVTLAAFYLGYRLFGVAGMLLLPICAALTKQLRELVCVSGEASVRVSGEASAGGETPV